MLESNAFEIRRIAKELAITKNMVKRLLPQQSSDDVAAVVTSTPVEVITAVWQVKVLTENNINSTTNS